MTEARLARVASQNIRLDSIRTRMKKVYDKLFFARRPPQCVQTVYKSCEKAWNHDSFSNPQATDIVITKLFRRLSLKLHPDKQPHAGPQPFQQLQRLYATKDVLALLATALKEAVDLPDVCEELISDCERKIKDKHANLKLLWECLVSVRATDLEKANTDREEFMYKGAMEGGKPHGRGVMEWASGKVYDGEWLHGRFHGMGTYSQSDGYAYSGHWKAGQKDGLGKECLPGVGTYEGFFSKDKYHGVGELQMSDGGVYSGSWHQGKRQGNGIENHKLWSYDGQWLEDNFHGWGMYIASDGYSYCGCWKAGKREGPGIMCSPDGSLYKGGFLDNFYHGHGELIILGTGYSYLGSWCKGERHGKGIERNENYMYDGRWCSGLMFGFGTLHKGDRIYEGQFAKGQLHGYGGFCHIKGVKMRFAGRWENYKPVVSGGTTTDSDGRSFKRTRLH